MATARSAEGRDRRVHAQRACRACLRRAEGAHRAAAARSTRPGSGSSLLDSRAARRRRLSARAAAARGADEHRSGVAGADSRRRGARDARPARRPGVHAREQPGAGGHAEARHRRGPRRRGLGRGRRLLRVGPGRPALRAEPDAPAKFASDDGKQMRVPIANPNRPVNVIALAYRFGGGRRGNVRRGNAHEPARQCRGHRRGRRRRT